MANTIWLTLNSDAGTVVVKKSTILAVSQTGAGCQLTLAGASRLLSLKGNGVFEQVVKAMGVEAAPRRSSSYDYYDDTHRSRIDSYED
jgi:hypothetical protein